MDKNVSVKFSNKSGTVNANVTLLSFKEKDTFIVYTPQLDLSGYGSTYEDALKSFETSLEMFLDYTLNKKTVHKVLIDLGWHLMKGSEKKPKKVSAPSLTSLISKNDYLADLLDKQNLTSTKREIAIPI
ncbi:hypothetical protein ACYSNM_11335 [Myroides sp. LJL116]